MGVMYGILSLVISRMDESKEYIALMTMGFIFMIPFVIGFITVFFSNPKQQKSWLFRILAPWITSIICLVFTFIIGWEGTICVIMLSPIYLALSSLGGVVAGSILSVFNNPKPIYLSLGIFLFLPFGMSSIETRYPNKEDRRTVHTEIIIHSTPGIVWKNIIRVPKITEKQDGFFYKMGFPKPVEANLSKEGVGGIRNAKFERGLYFTETITKWKKEKKIGFIIQSHPESTPTKTLDTHVVPGGEFFDALYGEYEIVELGKNKIQLKLLSQYRLSTRFNFYASLWSDFLMRDIQNNILKVLKKRCESTNPK